MIAFDLIEVHLEDKPVLARLMQLYLHDLSAYNGDDVGPEGLYRYAYLDHYWVEPGRHAFLVLVADRPAGFALVRTLDPSGPTYSMAEFFIMRKHRRQGLGRAVAQAVFDRLPGQWHVATEAGNLPAQAFWRQVLGQEAEILQAPSVRYDQG